MRTSKAQRLATCTALVLASLLLGGWSPFGNRLTLGASLQLTGPLAQTGRYYRDGYQFTVDRINEKGGVAVAGKSYTLDLNLLDNKSDSKLNLSQHERLVTRTKVNFLLGPYSSTDVLAAAGVAEKNRVPMVQAGGASTRIFSRGYKYVFGTLPPATDYFRSTIEMMDRLAPRPRTVALISGDDSFDVTVAEGTIGYLKNAGLEVVLHQQYSERSANFYNILTLIKARAPDVILWSGHENGAINFIRESKLRKIGAKLLACLHGRSAEQQFSVDARQGRQLHLRHDAVASERAPRGSVVRRCRPVRQCVREEIRLSAGLSGRCRRGCG